MGRMKNGKWLSFQHFKHYCKHRSSKYDWDKPWDVCERDRQYFRNHPIIKCSERNCMPFNTCGKSEEYIVWQYNEKSS